MVRATDKAQGEATVGLPPSLATILAPSLVDECRRVFPDVKVRIIEGLSIFLEEWLALGRIDLAILTDPGELSPLNRKQLAREELVLVGDPSLVHPTAGPIAAAELAGVDLVITRGFRNVVDPVLAQAGLQLSYALELDSIPIIKDMLARGQYATLLPFALVHKEASAGTLSYRPVDAPRLARDLVIATNPKRPATSAIKAVCALLVQHARDLPLAPA